MDKKLEDMIKDEIGKMWEEYNGTPYIIENININTKDRIRRVINKYKLEKLKKVKII